MRGGRRRAVRNWQQWDASPLLRRGYRCASLADAVAFAATLTELIGPRPPEGLMLVLDATGALLVHLPSSQRELAERIERAWELRASEEPWR